MPKTLIDHNYIAHNLKYESIILFIKRVGELSGIERITTLAKQVKTGHDDTTHEKLKQSSALRAVYNSLQKNAARFTQCAQAADDDTDDPILNLAIRIDRAIKQARPDDWRGFAPKENRIKTALLPVMGGDMEAVLMLFPVIVAQRAEY